MKPGLLKTVVPIPPEEQIRMNRFFDLTKHLNVYEIKTRSDEIRERMQQEGRETEELVYGEVSYQAMYELSVLLKGKGYLAGEREAFLDLGSGVGKAMVMAAFVHPFQICYGFEVIPELHEIAQTLVASCQSECPSTQFQPMLGDYMQEPWPAATVILANSTCLSRDGFENLMTRAEEVAPGTIFISMSKSVHRPGWVLVDYCQKVLHWGMCSFHVYVRKQS